MKKENEIPDNRKSRRNMIRITIEVFGKICPA